MSDDRAEGWERIRGAGKKRFLLRYGVGGAVAFTLTLAVFWYWRTAQSGLFDQIPGLRSGVVWLSLALILIGAPIFGAAWAWLSWQLLEAVYRRNRKKSAGA